MSSDSGSVQPIKSKHQAHPWQPTVDSSDGSQSAAGKDYTDVYGGKVHKGKGDQGDDSGNQKSGHEPVLKAAYTTAPDFVASTGSGSGKDGPTAMESGRFSVQLAVLHSTEQTCLDATSAMVTGYGTLKAEVDTAAADGNFFGQQLGTYVTDQGPAPAAWNSQHWEDDEYDQEAQEFAAAIIPQMKNLLNSIGNVVEACGQFNALLNNAGQIYATVDHNAEFKDA